MKRKITLFIAAAGPFAIALVAAGWGGAASGSSYPSRPYGSAVAASAPTRIVADPRANGSQQVTYAGHPLYRYVQDQPAGKKIESDDG
jgi:hypothetical protein